MNALLLWAVLAGNGQFSWDWELVRNLPIIAVASAIMGAALWYAMPYLAAYTSSDATLLHRIAGLSALVFGGGIVFFGILMVAGTFRLRQLLRSSG